MSDTVRGIENENLPCGVGFVIIPENIDREEYIRDVYRTGRISIFGGYGHSNFYNILIDDEVLQRITFPPSVGKMGSPVLWVNIPKHNEPIVVSSFKYDEEPFNFSEFSKKITRVCGQNITDLTMDAKNGIVKFSMNTQNKKSQFEINVNCKTNDSIFTLKVNGKTIIHSSDKIVAISEKGVETAVTNVNGKVIVKTSLSNDTENNIRFTYEDEFKNKIQALKDKLMLRADSSKKIDFGDGKEAAVLGKTLLDLLTKYDQAFEKMTVNTAFGPSSIRVNDAEFKAIREQFETFLSTLVNLD